MDQNRAAVECLSQFVGIEEFGHSESEPFDPVLRGEINRWISR
jgi:hypothetical protein